MHRVALLVIAKEPLPGRVKTRLTPPCTPEDAAALARAALSDTLDVVARTPAARRVLVFDGDPRRWRRDGFEVIAQRGSVARRAPRGRVRGRGWPGATSRDGHAPADHAAPAGRAATRSLAPTVDAVLGPRRRRRLLERRAQARRTAAFAGVPMSCETTWRRQRRAPAELRLRIHEQPVLRDVDTIDDARAVALEAPGSRFAATLHSLAA